VRTCELSEVVDVVVDAMPVDVVVGRGRGRSLRQEEEERA